MRFGWLWKKKTNWFSVGRGKRGVKRQNAPGKMGGGKRGGRKKRA